MAIAVYNAPPGGSQLIPAKTTQKVVGIQLNTPNNVSPFWAVFGKVVVINPNVGPVIVEAQLLLASPATLLDRSFATIPANGSESISLEGVAMGGAPMCVEIISTAPLAANAELARLIAISVNPAVIVTC